MNTDSRMITMKQIGTIRSHLTAETGAPRQGRLEPGNKSVIEILPEYKEGLTGLDKIKYIYVFYFLDQSEGFRMIVQPPGSDTTTGLFASRSPRRPSPVGLGLAEIVAIDNNFIEVKGLDAFDGTPVIDIKPYIHMIDSVDDQSCCVSEMLGMNKVKHTNPTRRND